MCSRHCLGTEGEAGTGGGFATEDTVDTERRKRCGKEEREESRKARKEGERKERKKGRMSGMEKHNLYLMSRESFVTLTTSFLSYFLHHRQGG